MYKVDDVIMVVDRNLNNYRKMGVILQVERGAYRVKLSTGAHLILHPKQIERCF